MARLSLPRRALLTAVAFALPACASPMSLLKQGRYDDAMTKAWAADPETQTAFARAVVEAEAPELTVEFLSDDDTARLIGAHTARLVTPHWMLVRGTLVTRGAVLPYARFTLDVGREGVILPHYAIGTPNDLTKVTSEKAAVGSHYTTYKSPLCPGSGIEGFAVCLLLLPAVPFTVEKSGEGYNPPSEQAMREAAPTAARIADALRDRCLEPRGCTRYMLVRRPSHEDMALEVHASMQLGRYPLRGSESEGYIHVHFDASVRPGAKLAERTPIAIAVARTHVFEAGLDSSKFAPRSTCKGDGCAIALVPLDDKAVSRHGLAPPPRPPTLGTIATSEAKAPWWSRVAPSSFLESAAERQKADADTELALCTLINPSEDLSVSFEGSALPISKDKKRLAVPLVHLRPGGSLRLDVARAQPSSPTRVAEIVLRREGSSLMASAKAATKGVRPIDVTCVALDRDAVEDVVTQKWPDVLDAVELADEEISTWGPKADQRDLGVPQKKLETVRAATAQLAFVVGWDDPRVQSLVQRVDGLDAHVAETTRRWVEEKAKASPNGNVGIELTSGLHARTWIRRVDRVCEGERCSFVIDSADPVPVGDLAIVLADGRIVGVKSSASSRGVAADDVPPPSRGQRQWALIQRESVSRTMLYVPK